MQGFWRLAFVCSFLVLTACEEDIIKGSLEEHFGNQQQGSGSSQQCVIPSSASQAQAQDSKLTLLSAKTVKAQKDTSTEFPSRFQNVKLKLHTLAAKKGLSYTQSLRAAMSGGGEEASVSAKASHQQGSENHASFAIDKNSELAVSLDVECALENGPTGDTFSSLIAGIQSQQSLSTAFSKNKNSTSSQIKTFNFQIDRTMLASELEQMAQENECIVGLGDSVKYHLSAEFDKDPKSAQQGHLRAINAAAAWEKFYNNATGIQREVVIAIIDSGVDWRQEDLYDHIWRNPHEVANGIDDDGNGYVDDLIGYNFADKKNDPSPTGNWNGNFHGTHVAGIAAAKGGNGKGGTGVMPSKVRIMALNVFGSSPYGETANIDNAIRYAADNGAHVINMSLGGPGRAETTAEAMEYAVSKGATIVIAAGNEARSLDFQFYTPASYAASIDGAVAVGSFDWETGSFSDFSNYSSRFIGIAAPGGREILSTMPSNQYGSLRGTSMAAPTVAGALGLVIGWVYSRTQLKLEPSKAEEMLLAGSPSKSTYSGRINGGKSLDLLTLAEYVEIQIPQVPGGPDLPNPSQGGGGGNESPSDCQ
ncbi:MAG: hypothetical protein COT74_09290 [Bdellovibrionales bacterium CG10_big_fil_rev_8_21_14_0_10_45_34]|nr:MAG: hypothetical protein COT74_09290 [Bdellovibrionales bacterium CG10_big_fil_rev_8_21_14_0_10_45_34]